MRRRVTLAAITATAAHHAIELAAGIGVPGEPVLGRRRAVVGWGAAFAAHAWTATRGGSGVDRPLAAANGAYQALALQHYLTWPWRLRRGLPLLTAAEGLPPRWLPAYNAALVATTVAAALATIADAGSADARWHLAGLATLPAQHASARHHMAWLSRD